MHCVLTGPGDQLCPPEDPLLCPPRQWWGGGVLWGAWVRQLPGRQLEACVARLRLCGWRWRRGRAPPRPRFHATLGGQKVPEAEHKGPLTWLVWVPVLTSPMSCKSALGRGDGAADDANHWHSLALTRPHQRAVGARLDGRVGGWCGRDATLRFSPKWSPQRLPPRVV